RAIPTPSTTSRPVIWFSRTPCRCLAPSPPFVNRRGLPKRHPAPPRPLIATITARYGPASPSSRGAAEPIASPLVCAPEWDDDHRRMTMKRQPRILAGTALAVLMASAPLAASPASAVRAPRAAPMDANLLLVQDQPTEEELLRRKR